MRVGSDSEGHSSMCFNEITDQDGRKYTVCVTLFDEAGNVIKLNPNQKVQDGTDQKVKEFAVALLDEVFSRQVDINVGDITVTRHLETDTEKGKTVVRIKGEINTVSKEMSKNKKINNTAKVIARLVVPQFSVLHGKRVKKNNDNNFDE